MRSWLSSLSYYISENRDYLRCKTTFYYDLTFVLFLQIIAVTRILDNTDFIRFSFQGVSSEKKTFQFSTDQIGSITLVT